MTLHLETITVEQRQAIANMGRFMAERDFYLAGGTAVALCLGHRRSVDLDWFTPATIPDPAGLAQQLRAAKIPFNMASVEQGTLHGEILGVRVSLLEYRYSLLEPLCTFPALECGLASLSDLAAMKLLALTQRGAKKDFVDVYAIARQYQSLTPLLDAYRRKFSVDDVYRVLFALTYFEDADPQPFPEMLWEIDWSQIKRAIAGFVVDASK